MAEGRVFRKCDGRWQPVGEVLPVWDHAPPRPRQPINIWILPKGAGYEVGDVVAFGETGHRLLSLVAPDDAAWHDVAESAIAVHPGEHVRAWLQSIDLWLGMRLDETWR